MTLLELLVQELLVQELPKLGGWPEEANKLKFSTMKRVVDDVGKEHFHLPTLDRLALNERIKFVTREQYDEALAAKKEQKMKYEYLKGSEKDFDGAPEWATLYTSCAGEDFFFAEFHGVGARVFDVEKKSEFKIDYAFDGSGVDVIAERRQITEPSWSGIGLPPVGCECEFTLGPYEPDEFDDLVGKLPWPGTLVTVVSHKVTGDGHDVAVIYWDEEGGGRAACLVSSCLKPIRSEADKKRDAVIKALDDWFPEYTTDIPSLYHATAMYDAIAAGSIPGVKLED